MPRPHSPSFPVSCQNSPQPARWQGNPSDSLLRKQQDRGGGRIWKGNEDIWLIYHPEFLYLLNRYDVLCSSGHNIFHTFTKSPLLPVDVVSSLSSGLGYLFEGFCSIWVKIAQPLVVNFVVFRREFELQSFYSTILILSPSSMFFKWSIQSIGI